MENNGSKNDIVAEDEQERAMTASASVTRGTDNVQQEEGSASRDQAPRPDGSQDEGPVFQDQVRPDVSQAEGPDFKDQVRPDPQRREPAANTTQGLHNGPKFQHQPEAVQPPEVVNPSSDELTPGRDEDTAAVPMVAAVVVSNNLARRASNDTGVVVINSEAVDIIQDTAASTDSVQNQNSEPEEDGSSKTKQLRVSLVLLAIAVVIGIVVGSVCGSGACESSNGKPNVRSSSPPSSQPTPSPAATPAPRLFETKKLLANNSASNDYFGCAVAVEGDILAIGAYGQDNVNGMNGAVYLYNRVGSSWNFFMELQGQQDFGRSVALWNSTLVVGSSLNLGFVTVYEQDQSGEWVETAVLRSTDGRSGDDFGRAVTIQDTTMIIGAENKDSKDGSAYVFVKDEFGEWLQEARLSPTDAPWRGEFGSWVAVDSDKVMVGANGVQNDLGSAYVYVRMEDGQWVEQAKFSPSDSVTNALYGNSVAINNNTIAVGAPRVGATYMYEWNDEDQKWLEIPKIKASDNGVNFGDDVRIVGDRLIVGASNAVENGIKSGAAYLFERDPVSRLWVETTKLVANNPSDDDKQGWRVALSQDTAVATAFWYADKSGTAYVYEGI